MREEASVHDVGSLRAVVNAIDHENGVDDKLESVIVAEALLGMVTFFTGTSYLSLVTKAERVANIAGHVIMSVKGTALVPLFPEYGDGDGTNHQQSISEMAKTEMRYVDLFNSVDLRKDFYFSYTYDLSSSLQKNFRSAHGDGDGDGDGDGYTNRFTWNFYIAHQFLEAFRRENGDGDGHGSAWLVPLVHGFVAQHRLQMQGQYVLLSVIARRSRHFAGTRYERR